MKNTGFYRIIPILLLLLVNACENGSSNGGSNKTTRTETPSVNVPPFNADSAYTFIEQQVAFGPRVPNTAAHEATAQWLTEKFSGWADTVIVQQAQVKAYNGTNLNIKNIIASFNPDNPRRIMLSAHWDTRPYADMEDDQTLWREPIPGANDGGSGVGVLMEIARQIQLQGINIGIDIVLFDAEDHGQPTFSDLPRKDDTWCLGSQYWGRNLHRPGYSAMYGILLDMVGGRNSTFTMEEVSMTFAPTVMRRVWDTANRLGYGRYFVYTRTGPITDDHYYINTLTRIPTIDIIHRDMNTETGFGEHWHTHNDDMDWIDRSVLEAVGRTVLQVVYEDAGGKPVS